MKPKTLLISIYVKLKNAKKENLLTFALLFIAGILILIPGVTYLSTTFVTKIPATQTYDWLIARVSIVHIYDAAKPHFILCRIPLAGISFNGLETSAATCIASILLAVLNHSDIDLALSIGFLAD